MTKLDELIQQNPNLVLEPAVNIQIDFDNQRLVTLSEPKVENDKIVWAEIVALSDQDKELRLADFRRLAEQRRAYLFGQLSWRYERHQRETRMAQPTTDNIADLDAYAQALADITKQSGYPKTIVWPEFSN